VPGRLSGAWVLRDTRVPVASIFENLECGSSIEEIVEQYDIGRDQIKAVLEFAARSLDAPPFPSARRVCLMHILFDHNTPRGITRHLVGHDVTTAKERRWERLTNGELLLAADKAGFDVLLTADKTMSYQQNLSGRKIALVVLGNSPWRRFRLHLIKLSLP